MNEDDSKYYISCYNQDSRKLEHFNVPHSIYVYIIQLENAIRDKEVSSNLKKLYPHLSQNIHPIGLT